MTLADAIRKPSFWARFFQLVFGIVAFACVAEWADYSRFGYMVFVGVTSMLISLVFMGMDVLDKTAPLIALVIDGIWWVLWLVAAALVSDVLDSLGAYSGSRIKASVAFAWLAWFTFWITLFLDFTGWKSGGAPGPAPPTAPAV